MQLLQLFRLIWRRPFSDGEVCSQCRSGAGIRFWILLVVLIGLQTCRLELHEFFQSAWFSMINSSSFWILILREVLRDAGREVGSVQFADQVQRAVLHCKNHSAHLHDLVIFFYACSTPVLGRLVYPCPGRRAGCAKATHRAELYLRWCDWYSGCCHGEPLSFGSVKCSVAKKWYRSAQCIQQPLVNSLGQDFRLVLPRARCLGPKKSTICEKMRRCWGLPALVGQACETLHFFTC